MATYNDHPPPAPPQHHHISHAQPKYRQQTQPPLTQQRPSPASRRSKSFRSDTKIDLHETSAEKEAKRLHSKADPTLAMNEAEPSEVAAAVGSSLAPLRSIQHRDHLGNPIADPDRSNPTRSRWERPLDTIRSFEAAIDGGYSNRRSMLRSDSESVLGNNRRGSYYAGGNGNGGRFSHDSYYNSRPPSMMYSQRADNSQHDLRQGGHRETVYDQHPGPSGSGNSYPPGPPNGGPVRRGYPRMSMDPQYASGGRQLNPNEYAIPNNQRSYETVASGSGSGSSAEPSGYQTDPTSSDNSSIERVQVPPKPQQPMNDYGIGFSQNSAYQPPTFTVGVQGQPGAGGPPNGNANGYHPSAYQPNVGHNFNGPPPLPQKGPAAIARKPIVLNQPPSRPAAPEKRKSWFARRFSKN